MREQCGIEIKGQMSRDNRAVVYLAKARTHNPAAVDDKFIRRPIRGVDGEITHCVEER